jgi:putative transposase
MDEYLPPAAWNFSIKPLAHEPKQPHAPVHRLSEFGTYIVTAGTFHKQQLFATAAKLDMLERMLLMLSKRSNWHLEAWAVLANHYHFVARGAPDSVPMSEVLRELHSLSAREVNRLDNLEGRRVWHNYWDTRLTFQHSYLARLNYVHQNAVKHGLVAVANQYRWCSAAWFERVASPAQVKTIYLVKIDKVQIQDDF